jgi:hypothetical protein
MPITCTPAFARHRISPAAFAFSLLLGACNGSPSAWQPDIPSPPAAPYALDEPPAAGPVLASRQRVPAASVERTTEGDLLDFFEDWHKAWVAGDFQAYVAHYAAAFTGNGTAALRWQTRHHRMVRGSLGQARLSLGEPGIEIEGDGRARISFSQHFEGGGLVEIGSKQWQLRRVDGRWQIQQEIFERRGR